MQSNDPIFALMLLALGGVFTVLWWLLRAKDAAQGRSIDILFEKHDVDAQKLQDLELKIASRHYEKSELDSRFDRLEQSFQAGQREILVRLDKMTDALISGSKQ